MSTESGRSPSAIITGAANGIGRAVAQTLTERGYRVLLVDRDAERLKELATLLETTGARVIAQHADVAAEDDVRRYVDRAMSEFGQIDGLFNNAGIVGPLKEVVDYPTESFDQVLSVNLRGVFLGMKYVLREMYQHGQGSVVNTASVAGQVGHVEHGAYVATKHAVIGLTKVAGAESASRGVRVNAVAPGPVRTQMIEAIEAMKSPENTDLERQRLLANIPAHRYGTAAEVAQAVAFLLGPDSQYINGTVLTVDGAFTAIR
jgi:NAD(P)-dependent dehydrogenase (short-subunit alcohol dehydrogenase family)